MIDRKTEDITDYISNIKNNIQEFKSTQIAGGDSFVNYTSNSLDSSDFTLVMDVSQKTFRLTFTHELPKYNIVDLSIFFRVDNSSVMANPYVSNAVPYVTNVSYEQPQLGVTTWIVNCTNLDYSSFPSVNTHTYYFKFYFNGTTKGAFSASVL